MASPQPASPGGQAAGPQPSVVLAENYILSTANMPRGNAEAWAGYGGPARGSPAPTDALAAELATGLQLADSGLASQSVSFISGSFHGQSDSGLWRLDPWGTNAPSAPGLKVLDHLEGSLSSINDFGPSSATSARGALAGSQSSHFEAHAQSGYQPSASAPSQAIAEILEVSERLQRGRSSLEQPGHHSSELLGFISGPTGRGSLTPPAPLSALSSAQGTSPQRGSTSSRPGPPTTPGPPAAIAACAEGPRRTNQGYRKLWQQVGRGFGRLEDTAPDRGLFYPTRALPKQFLANSQITKVGKGGKLVDGAGAPNETTVEDLIRIVLKLAPTDSAVRAVEKVGGVRITNDQNLRFCAYACMTCHVIHLACFNLACFLLLRASTTWTPQLQLHCSKSWQSRGTSSALWRSLTGCALCLHRTNSRHCVTCTRTQQ